MRVSSRDYKQMDEELKRVKNLMFTKGETIALSDL